MKLNIPRGTWARSALIGALLSTAFAAQANKYTVVDLGPVDIFTQGLNDRGEIAAQGYWGGQYLAARVYRNGKWRSVGSPEDKPEVNAINQYGDLAGSIGDFSSYQPVIFPREGGTLPLELPPGGTLGVATAFAGRNTVVGQYRVPDLHQDRCFMTRRNGGPIDLGLPSDDTVVCHPQAANDGWVTGYAHTGPSEIYWVWKDGVFTKIGDLGTRYAYPYAVNKHGHVVGNGMRWAFLWNGVKVQDIGVSDRFNETSATSINDHGEIVGTASYTHRWLAARFEGNKVIILNHEVPDLGDWSLVTADAINNDGVIVGFGRLAGQSHGYMLVPIAP